MTDFTHDLAASRAKASDLWAELEPYRFKDRGHLIRAHRRFVSWGLCERLCQESARLTPIDPDRAVEAAELAVLVSDLMKEDDSARARYLYRLRSYAWAHDGNARRVLGDLRGADESFSIAEAWGEAGEDGSADVLGYESVLLDFEASLRIAQRRLPEALELLDRMFALHNNGQHRDAHLAGRALVKQAIALHELEESERVIELLRQAEPLVDVERDPRLLFCLRHNLL